MPFTAPQKSPAPRHGVAGLSQLIKIMCGDASAVLLTAAFTMIEVYRNASGLMAGIMLLYLAVTIFVSRLQIRSQKGIREAIILQKNVLDGKICQAIKNLKGSASLIKVKALLNIAFQDVDPIFSIRSTGAAPQAEPEIRFDGVAVNGRSIPTSASLAAGKPPFAGSLAAGNRRSPLPCSATSLIAERSPSLAGIWATSARRS